MVKGLPAALVEAFTEKPLAGNGAGVVLLNQPAPSIWMQRLAGRLRQSETAFLLPLDGAWALRWFTPSQEVPLCGHGTLAALLALGHWQRLPAGADITFLTRSGPLGGRLLAKGAGASPALQAPRGQLDLPWIPLEPQPVPEALAQLLLQRLHHPPEQCWHSPLGYQVVLLPAAAPLARLEGLADALTGQARQGLVVMQSLGSGPSDGTTVAGEAADYQLRFFAPGLGIDEDPVTGSAHALVAPFWMRALKRPRVVGWQCSDRPGGMVCEAGSSGMIRLTGSGHLLWDGTVWAEPGGCSAPSETFQDWREVCGL